MMKKILLALLLCIALIAVGIVVFLQHPMFVRAPNGASLERVNSSPNYVDAQFQNLIDTPMYAEQERSTSLREFLFTKRERLIPIDPIPTVKTDLMTLDKTKDIVVWLGHSSYYLQLGGKRILIDPVLSSYASPVFFVNKSFGGTNIYTPEDIPDIDYLLISHDHWDHLDYPTVTALKPKIKNVITSLGVGAYFEQWGFDTKQIHEKDWFSRVELEKDFVIHVLPARHFSGRLLTRNKTLWAGFAIDTPGSRIFYSGDSGYGPHFKQIGDMFNDFDLVIMENGQYDKRWPYIHMMPEEVAKAAEDLKAKALLPGHSGKFAIANHPWDEPLKRIAEASKNSSYRLLTPVIGDQIEIGNREQRTAKWWEGVN